MAQVWTAKQENWVQRLSNNVVGFLANMDAINLLVTEAQNDGYLSGGAEQLADTTVQTILPAATAALLFSAVGAFANSNEISAIVAANRQALELMRP
jgi:hypothetical protein